MGDEPMNLVLERLIEETAEAIIFTLSAAASDPKPAIMRLLRQYLEQAQEQAYDETLRGQQLEERDQQN